MCLMVAGTATGTESGDVVLVVGPYLFVLLLNLFFFFDADVVGCVLLIVLAVTVGKRRR